MTMLKSIFALLACLSTVMSYHYGGHSISLPIKTDHEMHTIHHGSDGGQGHTTKVNIQGGVAPIKMHFESKSSPIYMSNSHHGGGGSYGHSSSYDKPHVREHTVYKPIVHKLTEIVSPYKYHKQIIKPVKKSIQTMVHKGGHGY